MASTALALTRTRQARRRAEAYRARTDTRAWVMQRSERTRRLIELGGLVQKAGLAELVDDDRAALYGAFLEIADQLGNCDGAHVRELWRRRGKRTFEAEATAPSPPFVGVTE